MILQVTRLLQPGRGARRRRQRQDGARAAAGQGADPRPAATARPSGWRCSATRSGSRSTSSAQVAGWPRKDRPAFVGTFHEFGRQWGAPDGDREDSDFWEERLPRADGRPRRGAAGRGRSTTRSSSTRRRTSPTRWWRPVLKALRDEERGRALRLLRREPADLRALRPAAGAAGPARARPQPAQHQADPRVLRPAGAEPDVRARRRRARGAFRGRVRRGRASSAADDEVDALLEAGWKPENICLLTTGHRHPVQVERTELPRPGGLLADLLGRRRRLLRPRPRLQGARAARGRAVRQRGRRARPRAGAAVRRHVARHRHAGRGRRPRRRARGRRPEVAKRLGATSS